MSYACDVDVMLVKSIGWIKKWGKFRLEHDPRLRGDKPYRKTGFHPRVKPEGMLLRIVLWQLYCG